MRFLVIAFFLLVSQFCFAQTETVEDNYFCIKTSPIPLIDVYGSNSYRLGAEFKLIGNTAFSFEAGQYFGFGGIFEIKHHPKGFILRPEFKVYLNKDGLTVGPYISIDAFYKKIDFGYTDSIRFRPNPPFEKTYNIWKNVYSINVRYGEMLAGYKMFTIEWFAGGGIRYIKGRNDLSPEENDNILTGENHGNMIGDGQRAISGLWPNITAGFKVCFAFATKNKRIGEPVKYADPKW
jgi:hypothetical protein